MSSRKPHTDLWELLVQSWKTPHGPVGTSSSAVPLIAVDHHVFVCWCVGVCWVCWWVMGMWVCDGYVGGCWVCGYVLGMWMCDWYVGM